MPDAVAGEAGIRIAVIFAPVRAEGAQIIAQFIRRDGKKGTQHMPPVIPGAHAAESGPARAAQQTQEHVFLGVSGMVSQKNPVRTAAAAFFFQSGIAQTARGFLHAFALTASAGNIHDRHAAGNAQRGADADGMRGIVAGLRAQTVIDA